jgi:hypothetical protein
MMKYMRNFNLGEEKESMQLGSVIPMVIERGHQGERAYDIYSLLLKERIIVLGSQINDQTANLIVAKILNSRFSFTCIRRVAKSTQDWRFMMRCNR